MAIHSVRRCHRSSTVLLGNYERGRGIAPRVHKGLQNVEGTRTGKMRMINGMALSDSDIQHHRGGKWTIDGNQD